MWDRCWNTRYYSSCILVVSVGICALGRHGAKQEDLSWVGKCNLCCDSDENRVLAVRVPSIKDVEAALLGDQQGEKQES